VGTQKTMNFLGVAALAVSFGVMPAFAGDLYSDIPATDVNGGPETTSLSTYVVGNSFGSLIDPSTSGVANYADVMLSNYNTSAQSVSLTFDLYAIGSESGHGNSANGYEAYNLNNATLVDSQTQSFSIPGFPATGDGGNPVCTSGGGTLTNGLGQSEATCGQLFDANFTLAGDQLTAGQQYVWTIAGMNAASGLNVELNDWCTDPTLGCDPNNPINTTNNPEYNTNYLGGSGTANPSWYVRSLDGQWSSIGQGEVAFSNAPEPATLGLIGLGLLGIGFSVRKKSGKV